MAAIMSAAFKVAVTLTRMAISPWYYQPSREEPPPQTLGWRIACIAVFQALSVMDVTDWAK